MYDICPFSVQAKLSTQVYGEQSLLVSTRNIRAEATQKHSVSNFSSSLGEFQFFMPSRLEEQLNITERCFGTMITIFQENPYFSDMVMIVGVYEKCLPLTSLVCS